MTTVRGFCDHVEDRPHFEADAFDLIISRQLANCLYDPIAAFKNWHHWLSDGGLVVVMDGLYDRNAWSEKWEGIVDSLPLSACQTTATVPYLLEYAGFEINTVGAMKQTNGLASTRTPRYLVVATKRVPGGRPNPIEIPGATKTNPWP